MDYDKMDKIFLKDLTFRCIIGIYPEERTNKQDVIINLTLYTDFQKAIASEKIEDTVNYERLGLKIKDLVENSSFLLVEKLAQAIAACSVKTEGVQAVKVQVKKPEALRFTKSVGVEIFRTAKIAGWTGSV
ncbi:MAG: dihydroneopterin aldolase [Spirochaetaceae bacterium 4572_59]|nr:MAG: dihydroneopterin aldolase [Spirochaetaceae bacterium 4572_59]